jgi:hypothetical protein
MKRDKSKRSDSSCAANQKFNNFIPDDEPQGYEVEEQLSPQGGLQRSMGILMSGLLVLGLLAAAVVAAPSAARAASIAVGISVRIGPPPLPVYTQPVCPAPGYMWTPGYWAYDPVRAYFWVPGTWVMAPAPGLLWTPGYWGWGGSAFIFHAGYWGPHVGFYGGINYGFGYTGVGFVGGEWRGGAFFYNRSVNNFGGGHFANVYYRPVVNNFAVNRVSFNGGEGGLRVRPTPGEMAAEHDRHIEATSIQRQHEMAAHNDRAQFASENHGRPGVAATGRPGEFRGAGVVQASRAGGEAGAFHGTNPGHVNGYSGTHSSNPGGGGNHQVMTAHQNSPSSHSYGTHQSGMGPGQVHSTSSPHNESSHGLTSNHQAESHQRQTEQHSSKPSGGGQSNKHEPESRR